MKALLLAALLSQAPDAPVVEVEPETHPAIELHAGESLNYDAVCLDSVLSVRTGKRIASCEAEVAAVEKKAVISTPLLIAGIVAAVALGFGGGFAVAKLAK